MLISTNGTRQLIVIIMIDKRFAICKSRRVAISVGSRFPFSKNSTISEFHIRGAAVYKSTIKVLPLDAAFEVPTDGGGDNTSDDDETDSLAGSFGTR